MPQAARLRGCRSAEWRSQALRAGRDAWRCAEQRGTFAMISGHADGGPSATTRHGRKRPSWDLALPGRTSPQEAGRGNPPRAEEAKLGLGAPRKDIAAGGRTWQPATGGRSQAGAWRSQEGHRRRRQDVATRHGRKRPSWGLALPGRTSPQEAIRHHPPRAEEADQAIGVPRRAQPHTLFRPFPSSPVGGWTLDVRRSLPFPLPPCELEVRRSLPSLSILPIPALRVGSWTLEVRRSLPSLPILPSGS